LRHPSHEVSLQITLVSEVFQLFDEASKVI